MVGPNITQIARLAVSEQSDLPGSNIKPIKLKPLTSSDIFAEDKIIAGMRMIGSAGDTIREESQLPTRPARHLNLMHLHRIGKACPDQHLAPPGMPGKDVRAAKLSVTIRAF